MPMRRPYLGSIQPPPFPQEGAGWSWSCVVVISSSCQTQLKFCQVLCISGMKLHLLCGIMIKMAVGSSLIPGSVWSFNCLVEEGSTLIRLEAKSLRNCYWISESRACTTKPQPNQTFVSQSRDQRLTWDKWLCNGI